VVDDYDIVIIGGGLVGATLACALSPSPYRVALVEARLFGAQDHSSYDDRSLALAFGSRRILSGLALWDATAPTATPIKTIHVSERGRFGATRLCHDEEGVEALGYVVPNRDIGRVLYARLSGQGNLDVIAPARVQDFYIEASHVAVRVAFEVEDADTQYLRCRLLVAADGANSAVRRRLGIGVTVADYAQTAIVAKVKPSRHHACAAFERFTDTGPIALLPMSEGRCSLVWTHTPEGAKAAMRLGNAAFLENLQDRFGYRLGCFIETGARSAYPLSLSKARAVIGPRVVLIGNAAHTLHPVAAQGFNLSLRDVAVLTELLFGSAPNDPGDQNLLTRYAALRKADLRRTARLTDGLARLFTNPFKPLAYARPAALLTLDLISPLRHRLAHRAMGISGPVPRLTSGIALAEMH